MNILLINALIYIIAFIYFFKRQRFTIYTMLWFEFTVIAFLGYYTFEVGIYEETFGRRNLNDLEIAPYIFVFIGYIIAFEPFRKIDPKTEMFIPNRKYTKFLLSLFIIVMTAYLMLKIGEAIISVKFGLARVKELNSTEGVSLFDYSDNILLKALNRVKLVFQIPLTPFIVTYCIQCWKNKEQTFISIILLLLCFLPDIFAAVARGSRAGIFTAVLNVVFFAVLYFDQISVRVKVISMIGTLGFLMLAGFYSLAITNDRWKNVESPIEPILRYFGEPYPNVGFSFYGKVREYTHGGYLFQEFVIDTEKKGIKSMSDSQKYWGRRTGTPVLTFTTYWGGMYIEFGTIGAFIFIILYAWIIRKLTGPQLTVYNMCFLYFYFRQMSISFARLTGFTVIKDTLYSIVAMVLVSYVIKKLYYDKGM